MEVSAKKMDNTELPEGFMNDVSNIALHAYNEFKTSFDMDSHTIQDIFCMAFISGVINSNLYNRHFKCIENQCDSDCDNCDVTRFIKIHELSMAIDKLYNESDCENNKTPEKFD